MSANEQVQEQPGNTIDQSLDAQAAIDSTSEPWDEIEFRKIVTELEEKQNQFDETMERVEYNQKILQDTQKRVVRNQTILLRYRYVLKHGFGEIKKILKETRESYNHNCNRDLEISYNIQELLNENNQKYKEAQTKLKETEKKMAETLAKFETTEPEAGDDVEEETGECANCCVII